MHEAQGQHARKLRAYISGESGAFILQEKSITSGILNILPTYSAYSWSWVVIVIVGSYFVVAITFVHTMHCSSFDHRFRIIL